MFCAFISFALQTAIMKPRSAEVLVLIGWLVFLLLLFFLLLSSFRTDQFDHPDRSVQHHSHSAQHR
jgi:hypothetical protein